MRNFRKNMKKTIYCGWLRNPAPVENGGLSHYGLQPSKVVQDFFHTQYNMGT